MYFNINLNYSKFNKKVHLLVSKQYIDSVMYGATIEVLQSVRKLSYRKMYDKYWYL